MHIDYTKAYENTTETATNQTDLGLGEIEADESFGYDVCLLYVINIMSVCVNAGVSLLTYCNMVITTLYSGDQYDDDTDDVNNDDDDDDDDDSTHYHCEAGR